jgi:arsenate reductase
MRADLLYSEGCTHAAEACGRLKAVLDRLAPGTPVHWVPVWFEDAARAGGALCSPCIVIDGAELDGQPKPKGHPACRNYGEDGLPPEWLIEAAVARALKPRSVLFLCVANSARSQMAEGIARSLAPPEVQVSSAGSAPTSVRPEAIEVLREIGIDISAHRSKSVRDIDTKSVEAVVTLCADEVCPAFPGKVTRLHWALPDPAAASGDREARLAAFRACRDELCLRISMLFPARGANA